MRVLLDSHTLVWALTNPMRLSQQAADLLSDLTTLPVVSSASLWELGIKHQITQSPELGRILSRLEHSLAAMGAEELRISHKHALKAAELPLLHKDPFDRMLIAQAIIEGVPLISSDRIFRRYRVLTVW